MNSKKAILLILLTMFCLFAYAEKVCPQCGETYSDNYKFCPKDGAKLVEKQTTENKKNITKLQQADIPSGNPDYTIKDMALIRISENEDTISLKYSLEVSTVAYVFLKYRIDKDKWQYCKNEYIIGDMNKVIAKETNAFSWVYGKEIKGIPLTNVEIAIDVWIITIIPENLKYIRTNKKGYTEFVNKKDGSTLVYIPSGKFTMGSSDGEDDEAPVHTVYLDGYYISKYEITNAQYKQFCDSTGRDYPDDPGFDGMSNYFTNYPDYPVVNVSWHNAKAYCDWAGLKLPTEARWEKGARGTDSRKYPWGDHDPYYNGSYYANYDPVDNDADGYYYTSPVGIYKIGQSPYGLMDMSGNVWEWCSDWYGSSYYNSSLNNNPPDPSLDPLDRLELSLNSSISNPKGPSSGSGRVIRGSSWDNFYRRMRCASRAGGYPSYNYCFIGLRPALD